MFVFLVTVCAEVITFSAKKMEGNTGDKEEYTKLIGDARIKTETLEIFADEILLFGKDFRFIKATGNIKGINNEAGFDFSCNLMKYDRETKLAVLEQNVNMIDKANDVNASAQIIEYRQDTEIAIMQIDVSIKQKENTCSGAVAIYRKAQQVLELSGNPKIERKNDVFRAQEILLNIKTEEIILDGKVRGSVSD
ncbi:MAG: organic solvent tolerance protein OstA [Treponema sp.]|nr:organic solvent tolerance protein OstA [Treponema sp.]